MKCNHCNVIVSSEFAFAIANNICPKCGKQILRSEQLAAYTSLKSLIEKGYPSIDSEKLANLIVANFELKQLFKEDIVETNDIEAEDDVYIEEPVKNTSLVLSDKDADELHKRKQMAEAKEQLKRMREEAYEDALKSQFGMGDTGGGIDLNPDLDLGGETSVTEMVQRAKQESARSKLSSGTGGFRRSDD